MRIALNWYVATGLEIQLKKSHEITKRVSFSPKRDSHEEEYY